MKTHSPGLATIRALCRALSLLALLLSLSGCFSFRVTIPPAPEDMVGSLAIIHSDPAALDLEKPIEDEPVTAGDPGIIALIKVLQVSRPMTLQWHWYSPDNRLVRSSRTVQINAKARYLAYFAAWDRLPSEFYAEAKGTWTVMITAGGSFLAGKEFTVN
ncbi:MAG: hypothetical protein MUC72_02355 [Acidobacteria bacterium]|nr:hypothetical protein [Acidobacteriota bacterium]